jgi:hypothetical protein
VTKGGNPEIRRLEETEAHEICLRELESVLSISAKPQIEPGALAHERDRRIHVLARPIGKVRIENIVVFPSGDDGKAGEVIPVTKAVRGLDAVGKVGMEVAGAVDVHGPGRVILRDRAVRASDQRQ